MKDAKGHGSNTGTKGMRLVKTHVNGPHSAKVYKNPEWEENVVKFFHNGVYQSKADSHTDDMADAHATAQHQLQRYADQDAKASLASGAKSATAPVHDSMSGKGSLAHLGKTVSDWYPGITKLDAPDSATYNDKGHVWGSPEAGKDFTEKYGSPRDHAAEQRGFNRGQREINRLRKQGR